MKTRKPRIDRSLTKLRPHWLMGAVLAVGSVPALAADPVPPPNYDESKVRVENLPDVMTAADGQKIDSVEEWEAARASILEKFKEHVYGYAPKDPAEVQCKVVSEGTLEGTSVRRREMDVVLSRNGKEVTLQLILFLPPQGEDVRGCFLMPNFRGNHTLVTDPAVRLPQGWMRDDGQGNNTPKEEDRGAQSRRTPVELICGRGYALASVYYGDIDPDFDDGFKNGVHALYPDYRGGAENPERWGSIAAWAWGLSRCADCLLKQPEIDAGHIAVIGHSRLGKTALWAGANDKRFSIVISNDSGEGGAALARREFGETVWKINTSFPHWFNDNYPKYNKDPSALPVDQHMLIAAIAPRPVYVASASEDTWADPDGEYMSAYLASPVYELYGLKGLPSAEPPPQDHSVGGSIGYHRRTGKHDLLAEDWKHYLDFADRHWGDGGKK